jgi:hypothetical protein
LEEKSIQADDIHLCSKRSSSLVNLTLNENRQWSVTKANIVWKPFELQTTWEKKPRKTVKKME